MMKPRREQGGKIASTEGASIVIALVFFLICAVIGSVVITVATVNSQATQSYRQATQEALTVTSAAKTFAAELQQGAKITWDYATDSPVPGFSATTSDFAQGFWTANSSGIWAQRAYGESFDAGTYEIALEGDGLDPVYASVKVDRDFNFIIRLSFSQEAGGVSPYNETVSIQAIPSFDRSGKLIDLTWADPVVSTDNTGPTARGGV